MKKLERMYDIIFQDEELKKLFLNFHVKNWCNLTIEEKKNIFLQINDKVANLYGYKPLKLNFIKDSVYGSHNSFKDEIKININSLKDDISYENIDTYFHELRHAFQCRAIEHQLTNKEYANENDILEWKKNFLPGNYLSQGPYYKYQEVEKDAWATGMLFARNVYLLNKQVIDQKDPNWATYCAAHKDVIVHFISENEESKEISNNYKKVIEESYASKIEDEEQFELGRKLYKEIIENKEISELDFKEVAILLSPYTFSNLDIAEKAQLIKRYSDLNTYGSKKFEVKINTTGSIKLNGKAQYITDPINIVNDFLSFNFKNIVDDIVNDRNNEYQIDSKAKGELKLNMFKTKEGKYLNFVKDSDNLFVFSLQPYAKYESYYILNEFHKLKNIELEVFKKNISRWKYWEDFYDNKVIYKTASKIIGMPFSEYYNMQLGRYRDSIAKYLYSIENKSN